MPGGRLTQRERQQIALGLADGLAYAEIARNLERPTSTITREVMRNGGPTAYRADLAHRATEQRSRRKQATPRDAETPPQAYGRDAQAVLAYEETFTTVLIQSGTPKMMARVMSCLTLTDTGSLTAAELVQRLQVSPASISKAVAFLESQGMVRRERDERRRERYVVDNDIMYQSMMASARSTAHMVDIARQGVGVLGSGTPAATRLENIARFLDFVSESMARAAEQARDILHTQPEPPKDRQHHLSRPQPAAGPMRRAASDQGFGGRTSTVVTDSGLHQW
ncbi:helix-turn-helix domain-containing protein [Streptomyces sp. NBC_00145]|uniref:helix-turn-helix domain-containing protein n=1 Tax=Streptomyces sp. NBC_00145 TaxID=2975666 RepID=UPI002E196A1D